MLQLRSAAVARQRREAADGADDLDGVVDAGRFAAGFSAGAQVDQRPIVQKRMNGRSITRGGTRTADNLPEVVDAICDTLGPRTQRAEVGHRTIGPSERVMVL